MESIKVSDSYDPKTKMSKMEQKWDESGDFLLQSATGFETSQHFYEPITLRFGRISYTPDFFHLFTDNSFAFIEVKASRYQRGFDKTMVKIKALAAAYPFFRFYSAIVEKDLWKIKEIEP